MKIETSQSIYTTVLDWTRQIILNYDCDPKM